ncbi:MAG: hypothetical protein LBU83_02705 [Bacteroidales bacterium]|nr:hypothetical protein [Bacteroidales bacterium]
MKKYRNTIGIILFALAGNFLLRLFPISVNFSNEDYSSETVFSAAPYFFGDAEQSINQSSPTISGYLLTTTKTKSQNGFSHNNHFCNLIFKNQYSSHFFISNYFEKTLLSFFFSSWFQVFGLRKIII